MNNRNPRRQKIISTNVRLLFLIILMFNVLLKSLQNYEKNIFNKDLTKTYKSPLPSSTSLNYDLFWERIWPFDLETQSAKEIAIDSDDNIYQTGYWLIEQYVSPPLYWVSKADVLLIKSNNLSEILWSLTWGYDESEYGRDVAVDSSNNIYVCGHSTNFDTGDGYMFLVKFNGSGNELWNQTWEKMDYTSGEAIAIDSEDNIYFVGQGHNEGSTSSIILIKYNSSGSILWERIWDNPYYDRGRDVCVDSQNNVIITGDFNRKMLIIKYDSFGNELWYKTWDQGAYAYGYAIDTDSNNSIYIGGVMVTHYPGIIENNLMLVKYDSSGYKLWDKICYKGNETVCNDMFIDLNGFIFLSGTLLGGGVQKYIYILIYDRHGNQVWNETWGGSTQSYGYGICIDSMGNIYVSGYTSIHQDIYDETVLLRYSKTEVQSIPEVPVIPGYNQLFLLSIFFLILICLIKKKFIRTKF